MDCDHHSDLKILKVQDPPREKTKPINPLLPQPPALLLMISPIRTGKSTIISNLLLNSNFYGQDHFDRTIVISPTIHNDKTSRFLKKSAECHDTYSDGLIQELIQEQSDYDDPNDRPDVALILDDIIGMIRRESYLNHLASRFRHYNIRLLLMSSQNYRAVSPIIRSNCTHMIIGSPFPNSRELGKIAEEIGDQFSGADNFLRIYHTATPEKYDFLYLDLQKNPPEAYKNFDTLIAKGGQSKEQDGSAIGLVSQSEQPKPEEK
jgi:hypothetical protein